MQRIASGLSIASAIAAVFVVSTVNLLAVGTGYNFCGNCWAWSTNVVTDIICAIHGC